MNLDERIKSIESDSFPLTNTRALKENATKAETIAALEEDREWQRLHQIEVDGMFNDLIRDLRGDDR